jgi:GntR family transcriptional regulator
MMTVNSVVAPAAVALEPGDMPLHRQLFLILRDQVERGALEPGERLPSESALCDQYGISRITVRRALHDLSAAGFLERRHGQGTFVTDHVGTPTAPRLTVMDELRQTQRDTTVEVVEVGRRIPPGSVAQALRIESEPVAAYVLRVRSRHGEPVMVTEAWLPARFAAETLSAEQLRERALFEILQQSGVTFGRVSQEITAEIADPLLARLLRVDIGSPLLRINRLVHDVDGTPVQDLSVHVTPERSRILTEYSADDIDTVASGVLAHRTIETNTRETPRRPAS